MATDIGHGVGVTSHLYNVQRIRISVLRSVDSLNRYLDLRTIKKGGRGRGRERERRRTALVREN